MPDLSAAAGSLAIALILIVLLWFAFGTQRNIRIGNDMLRWLQDGLPLLGARTTMRWLGSSAVELTIVEAADPFREATVVIVLEPRDVGLLWGWARYRGRRDFLIVRVSLRRAPPYGIDVRDPHAWTSGREAPDDDWLPLEWSGGAEARATAGADPAAARRAWEAIEATGATIWRLTVRPLVPHVELHVRPPEPGISSRSLLAPVRELAESLREGHR